MEVTKNSLNRLIKAFR